MQQFAMASNAPTSSRQLLPGYKEGLTDESSKQRYLSKLKLLNSLDPYEIPKEYWKDDVDLWPSTNYINVGMYLLFSPSPYTQEDPENYKSLECYQRFIAGWVRDVLVKDVGDKRVLTAKVNHSQKLREKPLLPWVICELNDKILAGHCNCMAGLGESCSHVASVLWAIEAGVRLRDTLTVTQKKTYWVLPPSVKDVPYAPLSDIKFKGKSATLSAWKAFRTPSPAVEQSPSPGPSSRSPSPAPLRTKKIKDPTTEEVDGLYLALSKCKSKPSILSLISSYSFDYVPKSLHPDLPPVLTTTLFNTENLTMNYYDLLKAAAEIEVTVTAEQCKAAELNTREQADSSLWFQMTSGRISASKLKSVCHTDPAMPAISLLMSICHPELSRFKTAATTYGCEHEKKGRAKYIEEIKPAHQEFNVSDCGFSISPVHPFIGASPDGLVKYLCCGEGVCEVQCPYCHRDDMIEDATSDSNFCLEKVDNVHQLKRDHAYYYQVQCQIYCTGRTYCDFVVWLQEDYHIERIYPDDEFMASCIEKSEHFFRIAILPELLGKFFSRPSTPDSNTPTEPVPAQSATDHGDSQDGNSEKVYCYCRGVEDGKMLGCDNPQCLYEWFHFECLQLTAPPRRKKCYCPDCRKLPSFRKKK